MTVNDRVVIVTGGGAGIGRALCRRFARDGARAVVVVDQHSSANDVAAEIGGLAFVADVSREGDVKGVVEATLARFGAIDLFCSNAGIGGVPGGVETANADWERIWQINVMAHVYAARAVLPSMLARGSGYLLQTASAAGLLSQIGSAPYSVTKHGAVAFAEWLAITYGDRGITVSCLCPQGVRTAMLAEAGDVARGILDQSAIEPDAVADFVIDGLAAERFLILPHPEVADYFRRKANDYDRWITGMRRLQLRVTSDADANPGD
jgi:NAD(P)-dependent dehydrogenase (short-subunit alcohol dehydrogenase family)